MLTDAAPALFWRPSAYRDMFREEYFWRPQPRASVLTCTLARPSKSKDLIRMASDRYPPLEEQGGDPSDHKEKRKQRRGQLLRHFAPKVYGRNNAVRSECHDEKHDIPGGNPLCLKLCRKQDVQCNRYRHKYRHQA